MLGIVGGLRQLHGRQGCRPMPGDAAYSPGNRALRLTDIPVAQAPGCFRALAAPDQLVQLALADWQPSFVQFLDELPSSPELLLQGGPPSSAASTKHS